MESCGSWIRSVAHVLREKVSGAEVESPRGSDHGELSFTLLYDDPKV
jgi:hypothetical protein